MENALILEPRAGYISQNFRGISFHRELMLARENRITIFLCDFVEIVDNFVNLKL